MDHHHVQSGISQSSSSQRQPSLYFNNQVCPSLNNEVIQPGFVVIEWKTSKEQFFDQKTELANSYLLGFDTEEKLGNKKK